MCYSASVAVFFYPLNKSVRLFIVQIRMKFTIFFSILLGRLVLRKCLLVWYILCRVTIPICNDGNIRLNDTHQMYTYTLSISNSMALFKWSINSMKLWEGIMLFDALFFIVSIWRAWTNSMCQTNKYNDNFFFVIYDLNIHMETRFCHRWLLYYYIVLLKQFEGLTLPFRLGCIWKKCLWQFCSHP